MPWPVRALTLLAAVVLGLLGATPARAEGGATAQVRVEATVTPEGVLQVSQTVTLSEPVDEFTQTFRLRSRPSGASYHRYGIDEFSATLAGEPADLTTTTRASGIEVTAAPDGTGPLRLSYEVTGATRLAQGADGDIAYAEWPLLQGLPLGVTEFEALVSGPATPQLMDCTAGPPGALGDCAIVEGGTFDQPEPVFHDGPLDPGDEVLIGVGYPAGTVAATADVGELWSLDRAFTVSWPTVTATLLLVVAGGAALLLLYRGGGRDASVHEATPIASFVPVGAGESEFRVADDVRPGHVGTVADERVDPIDITATLLDLAVRGHLRITELPREGHGILDWALEHRDGADRLAPFESELLAALGTQAVLVSRLPQRLAGRLGPIQDALYDDVVARGWFQRRPDSTRSSWRTRGYLAVVAAAVAGVLLIAFTGQGLVALALLGLAGALLIVSGYMPRRTASGARLLAGLDALAALLATHPTDETPRGRELEQISALLPYAVVLGGKQRWLAALVAADEDVAAPDPTTLDWYHAPRTWHLQDLPASLTQFIHTVQGALYSR